MPDREFKIKITGEAGGAVSAAKQTVDALNQVGQAANNEGKDLEETGKKTEFLGLKKGELKKQIQELGREFPIAGMAAKAMMNPIVAAFSAATAIFGYAKTKLEEWNKAMDEAGARGASRDFVSGIDAQKKAMEDAAVAAGTFAAALQGIIDKEEDIARKTDIALGKLRELTGAQEKIRKAEEQKQIAEIDQKEKEGKLSPAQAIAARLAVREHHRKAGEQTQTEAENRELDIKESALNEAQIALPELQYQATQKMQAAATLKSRGDKYAATLIDAEKKQAEYQAEVDKKLTARDEAESKLAAARKAQAAGQTGFGGGYGTVAAEAEARMASEEAAAAIQQRDQQAAFIAALKRGKARIFEEQLPGAEQAAKGAEAAATSDAQRISSLEAELRMLKETLPIRQAGRQEASQFEGQTATLNAAGQLADHLKQGQQKENQLREQIAKAAESRNEVTQEMLDVLKQITEDNKRTKEQMREILKNSRNF